LSQVDIPISKPEIGAAAEALVLEVLRSGRLAQGPMVERFEHLVAEAAGTEHAIAVSSGTTALVVAIEALELQPGDEVITSPFTFAATLNAILEAGATAVFADIGDDFNVDPDILATLITDRTKAVMPVHLYGLPADMVRISGLARTAGIAVIEDAAQSIGATVGDARVGSYGLGAFSFYATKNVTTGEGGAVTTDDGDLATRIRVLRNQGMTQRYQYEVPGHNYRMTELQAAVGIPQLERLDDITEARNAHARVLSDGLGDVDGLVLPHVPEGRTHVFNQFTVRVTDAARVTRDELAEALGRAGIATGFYYPRVVFDYDCYRTHPLVVTSKVPRAVEAASQVISLPVHPGLTDDDLARVVEQVHQALARD
jgi:perosamine synthetase